MKNRKAKKGFTIIELVIVIAVIGILAAVLIPTFSNVIDKANATAAMENAKNAYTNFLVDNADKMVMDKANFYIHSGDYYFQVVKGQFTSEGAKNAPSESNAIVATFEKTTQKLAGITLNANGEVVTTTNP